MNQRFEAGQFITFTYNPPARDLRKRPGLQTAQSLQPVVHDSQKSVFILHPLWHNEVHAIDLKRLTPAEVQVIHAVMDPKVKAAVDAGQWPVEGAPPYPLVRDILRRGNPVEDIKNPMAFYTMFVKPFLRDKDAYRKYKTQYMFGVKVIQESQVQGHVTNPKPLFGKPL